MANNRWYIYKRSSLEDTNTKTLMMNGGGTPAARFYFFRSYSSGLYARGLKIHAKWFVETFPAISLHPQAI